ncbi:MAG: hypothetical protein NWF06_02075 [Candidatus Bathyarchaeota archaeon]|nr:hypothetical protein [Candidatus Bathyarchaeum sp.]
MEAVLKIGGSLAEDPTSLVRLCQQVSKIAKTHKIAVVPGGGVFADTVRKLDRIYNLSNKIAHKMAILAMDQYGLFLSNIAPNSHISYNLEEIENATSGTLPIFLPSKLMFHKDPLENSWDITSDTIAAYIADLLHSKKLILVTDVDGIFSEDPKQNRDTKCIEKLTAKELLGWNKRTSVDKALSKMILHTKIDCYVVNGKHPQRIRLILENKKTVYTQINT